MNIVTRHRTVQDADLQLLTGTFDCLMKAKACVKELAMLRLNRIIYASKQEAEKVHAEARYFSTTANQLDHDSMPDRIATKLDAFYLAELLEAGSAAARHQALLSLLRRTNMSLQDLSRMLDPPLQDAENMWSKVTALTSLKLAPPMPNKTSKLVLSVQSSGTPTQHGALWNAIKKQASKFASCRQSEVEMRQQPNMAPSAIQLVHPPTAIAALEGHATESEISIPSKMAAAACVCDAVDCVLKRSHRSGLCCVYRDGRSMGSATSPTQDGRHAQWANAICVAAAHARSIHPFVHRIAVLDLFHGTQPVGTMQTLSSDPASLIVRVAISPSGSGRATFPASKILDVNLESRVISEAWSVVEPAIDSQVIPALKAFDPQLLLISVGLHPLNAFKPQESTEAAMKNLLFGTKQLIGGSVHKMVQFCAQKSDDFCPIVSALQCDLHASQRETLSELLVAHTEALLGEFTMPVAEPEYPVAAGENGGTALPVKTPSSSTSQQSQCCNPGCNGEAKARCSQCRRTRYCSAKCANAHWTAGHWKECSRPVT